MYLLLPSSNSIFLAITALPVQLPSLHESPANITVIAFSARAIGGHHYADIFAGLLLAVAAKMLATRITNALNNAVRSKRPFFGVV
jgi:hypothetical protein